MEPHLSPRERIQNYAANLCGRGSGSPPSAIKVIEDCDCGLRLVSADEFTDTRAETIPKTNKSTAKTVISNLEMRMWPPEDLGSVNEPARDAQVQTSVAVG
jgi:hypothetical protein